MSRNVSKVERDGIADTKYASGDSNRTNNKAIYQEENNNIVDKLSDDFSNMGCIVDKPNICVENCVHNEKLESETDGPENHQNDESHALNENDEDAYSDEFEDEDSENEIVACTNKTQDANNERISKNKVLNPKLSQSSTASNKTSASISGRSTAMSSIASSRSRRVNMSFTNNRLWEIERQNQVLLHKIISAKKDRHPSLKAKESTSVIKPTAPAAFQRKHQQRKINYENLILLKKIQRVKSSNLSNRH